MEELKKQIEDLQKHVAQIQKWQEKRDRQQLQLPLDEFSKNIINNYKNI